MTFHSAMFGAGFCGAGVWGLLMATKARTALVRPLRTDRVGHYLYRPRYFDPSVAPEARGTVVIADDPTVCLIPGCI